MSDVLVLSLCILAGAVGFAIGVLLAARQAGDL